MYIHTYIYMCMYIYLSIYIHIYIVDELIPARRRAVRATPAAARTRSIFSDAFCTCPHQPGECASICGSQRTTCLYFRKRPLE